MTDIKGQILDRYKDGDIAGAEDLTTFNLQAEGADAYPPLLELLQEGDQKLKGMVFEKLAERRDKDLLKPLSNIIAEERNPFLVRQELTAMAHFEFPETIDILEALEPKLSSDAQRMCQRTLAKLRAKFREHFYIKEFRKGSKNLKRMKSAADSMLKSPHPAYVGFLNKALKTNDVEMRMEAARVLHELGNADSLEAMFSYLQEDLDERNLTLTFYEMPGFKKEPISGQELAKWFASLRQVDWETEGKTAWTQMMSKEPAEIADFVLSAFNLNQGEVSKLNHGVLRCLFANKELPAADRKKARQMVKTRLDRQTETIERILLAMGAIAWRIKADNFTARLEALLPADDPEHDTWMIAALAGSGDPNAQQKLLAFLRDDDQPQKTRHVLEALSNLELDEVPQSIVDIAADPERGNLRTLALDLISKSKQRVSLLRELLKAPALVIKADVVQHIAEERILSMHDDLLDLLETNPNDSLLIVIIEALEHFHRETTGLTVQRFIMPPRALKIRQAALRTVFLASEDRGLGLAVEALERYKEAKLPEVCVDFLKLIQEHFPFKTKEDLFLSYRTFWEKLINHEDNATRIAAVNLIDKCNFTQEHAGEWSRTLVAAQNQQTSNRGFAELDMLRAAQHRANKVIEAEQKRQTLGDQMQTILGKLNGSIHYEKIQALRELTQNYKPDMLAGDSARTRTLVKSLSKLLCDHDDNFKTETLVLEAAGKLRHPAMRQLIEPYLEHKNWAVAKAAKKAHEAGVDESFKKDMIRKILAVDDSNFITLLVQKALSKRPYQVDSENDGNLALKRLKKEAYDLLMLDLKMPEIMGADFLRKAKEADTCPPYVLILTGNRNREDLMEVMSLGVDGIILKPFQAKDILNRIDDLIAKACGEMTSSQG